MTSVPLVLSRRPRVGREIPRERLVARCIDQPVVVISAPAGSGKSVVAGQLCDASAGRVAWCRLAPGFGDAADLAEMLFRSIGSAGDEEIGLATDVLVLAGMLLEQLETEPTVVVVDDYHEAEGDRCDQLLAEMIALLPDETTLVISGRSRPAGLLGRISNERPVMLDAETLAFDLDETAALFDLHERVVDDISAWAQTTGGWAAAVALAAEGTLAAGDDPADTRDVPTALLADRRFVSHHELLRALAVLPYVTADLASELGFGSAETLRQLGSLTNLASDADGFWRLDPSVADALATAIDDTETSRIRAAAASALESSDPATAIELHLGEQHHERAAIVLGDHLSEVGTDHAMRWLYGMPAEIRRQFPPALSAGRATVHLDVAIIAAKKRVGRASDSNQRREALLGLGSVHAGRGELADAADALEAATRLADPGPTRTAIHTQLALVRWWAGDLDGAAAALDHAGDGVWPSWIEGQLSLVRNEAASVAEAGRRCVDLAATDPAASDAPGRSLLAIAHVLDGRIDIAAEEAASAYRTALDIGGLDLAAAATVQGWVLLRGDRFDEAAAVVDVLQRQVGRQDFHAQVQAALLSRALSAGSGDTDLIERDERRLHRLRAAGYAPLESAAALLAGDVAPPTGLVVEFVGNHAVTVDGSLIPGTAWKSKKASEVLLWLAMIGPSGARREQVIEAIWPGREPEKGRTLLRTALSEVRRVLEPLRHRGEPSRFVTVEGDRVIVHATNDIAVLDASSDQTNGLFDQIKPGLATDLPDADWIDNLRRDVARLRVEAAERLLAADAGGDIIGALETLQAAEPWNRAHVDALMAAHRAAGDEVAANAVERRWFEDDD